MTVCIKHKDLSKQIAIIMIIIMITITKMRMKNKNIQFHTLKLQNNKKRFFY